MEIFQNILLVFFTLFVLLFAFSFLAGIFVLGPFVPTRQKVVERFASLIEIKNSQNVYELGCGDARLLRHLEKKYKVLGKGYERSPLVYIWAKFLNFIKKSKVEVYYRNFFKESLADADVIFLYLVPEIIDKLADKIVNECKSGTLVVSEGFKVPKLALENFFPASETTEMPNFYIYKV